MRWSMSFGSEGLDRQGDGGPAQRVSAYHRKLSRSGEYELPLYESLVELEERGRRSRNRFRAGDDRAGATVALGGRLIVLMGQTLMPQFADSDGSS